MGGFLSVFSERFWDVLKAAPAALLAFAIIFRFPQMMERWNERRRIRAEERAADWSRLRAENERLHARNELLEARLADKDKEIEQLHDAKMFHQEEATVAKATLQGVGEVRQLAAALVAAERLDDAEQKKRGERP